MGKIKNLANVVLAAGALACGSLSCATDASRYTGKIGEEQVSYNPNFFFDELIVIKLDGTKIRYVDIPIGTKPDPLDYIEVFTKKGQKSRYDADDELGRRVIEEGQKQYNWYLEQIQNEGIKDITGKEKPKTGQEEYPRVEEDS